MESRQVLTGAGARCSNGTLLLTAHFGARQAGAALAYVARPAAFF